MKTSIVGLDTKIVHAGAVPDDSTGAITTPLYQTSTFVQAAPGIHKGYSYSRTNNPTRDALEQTLAIIENGRYGLAFSSGVAAMDAVIKLLRAGDEVIAPVHLYGGTYRLFNNIFSKFGIGFHYVDMQDPANLAAKLNSNTKLVWVETPSNPLMRITNIKAIASFTKANDLLLCVDNTFATPYLQNPLDWGADIVLHSATKYLGGHSDVVLGCVVVNDELLNKDLRFIQNSCGAVPGPQDCFLVARGVKTLHLRMQRHCENGRKLATYLRNHEKVQTVYWCGFPDHPDYAIAKNQMRDFGGMISFVLKDGSAAKARQVLSSTKLFALAESLGGVESMINHPATMSHGSMPDEDKQANGIVDGLIRISAGVEDAADLIADIQQAIEMAV